ncbi:MAG TPA: hypothetical protein DCP92_09995 [Nitrospiraceae bacterium]|jgi:hypothetical protein|nr:hypothetical protein [Nitrospiraceae bacterium]
MVHQAKRKSPKFKYPPPPALDLKALMKKAIPRPRKATLLPWSLWFLKTEFQDLNRSQNTLDAARNDLQKFVSFSYHLVSGGDITNWSASVTNQFFHTLGAYQRSSLRRMFSSLLHF